MTKFIINPNTKIIFLLRAKFSMSFQSNWNFRPSRKPRSTHPSLSSRKFCMILNLGSTVAFLFSWKLAYFKSNPTRSLHQLSLSLASRIETPGWFNSQDQRELAPVYSPEILLRLNLVLFLATGLGVFLFCSSLEYKFSLQSWFFTSS